MMHVQIVHDGVNALPACRLQSISKDSLTQQKESLS